MKYVIVKYAQDCVWNFHFNEDPKLGAHISYSVFNSPTGKECGVKQVYEAHERDQAELDLEALNKANPVGTYALCPLIEESVEVAPNENTAPSHNDTFKFEIGKYYRHSSGKEIAILGEVDTTMYGKVFVAESNRESNLRPVGQIRKKVMAVVIPDLLYYTQ